MHTKILGLLASTLALGVSLASCSQPEITCRVAPGTFTAKYTLKSGSGPCSELKGEPVGMHGYNPLGADPQGGPNLDIKRVAIRTTTLGDLYYLAVDAEDILGTPILDPNAVLTSLGTFESTEPDSEGFCTAPTLNPSTQTLPVIPERPDPADETGMTLLPEEPAHAITYAWSNVQVRVTAEAAGTTMQADLTYTENGCTATYGVIGLYPSVACGKLDADGNHTDVPDTSLCTLEADPENGIAAGSGINPDLFDSVACDPDLLLCVLTRAPGGG